MFKLCSEIRGTKIMQAIHAYPPNSNSLMKFFFKKLEESGKVMGKGLERQKEEEGLSH